MLNRKEYNFWEVINRTPVFWYFIHGTQSLFYYQWYPRIIERFTTVTFYNFLRPKSFITVNFLLCFKLKNKRKRKKLNSFGRIWTEKV